MKQILIVLVAFTALGIARGQEKEVSFLTKKNEVKLNLPVTIFGSFPEVSYERIISEDFTVGASVGFSLKEESSYAEIDFMAIPYARWFFGGNSEAMQKYAAGFFIEASAAIISGQNNVYYAEVPGGSKMQKYGDDYTGIGLGVAIGWKYVTRNSWVGEILLGVGKNFSDSNESYPRIGISIGKRF